MRHNSSNDYRNYLVHHGIKGMKWGVKNGPPYPLDTSDYSISEKVYSQKLKKHAKRMGMTKDEQETFYKNHKRAVKAAAVFLGVTAGSIGGYYLYNKIGKRFSDTLLKEGSKVHTLAASKERMKGAKFIYEAHLQSDRATYKGLFGSSNGKLKVDITNKLTKNMKIASEKTAEDIFVKLFKDDKSFADYITNQMDLSSIKDKGKYNIAYRKAIKVLETKKGNYTDKDLKTIHKIFNYTIPNNGREATVANRKFFNELKKSGYSGLIDLNDSVYGHYRTRQSNILFDIKGLVTESANKLRPSDQIFSFAETVGRQSLPYLIGGGSLIGANEYINRQDERSINDILTKRNK